METINKAMLEQFRTRETPLLIDYWAPWCRHCLRLEPALVTLESEYKGIVMFGKVNIDEEPALSSEARITVIPTLKLYLDGEEAGMLTGPSSKAEIDAFLRAHVQKRQ